jgi:hypothetical protein
MLTKRLELALELLKPADWSKFEKIASTFLAAEFDDLRTTANPSGDEGRDSELFSPAAEPTVVFQYSVSTGWAAKINSTVRRLKKTHPAVVSLIYVSNQVIGALSDDLKRKFRINDGLSLDVRDRNWFVDRVLGHPSREKAAEELAEAIVDPYLSSRGMSQFAPSELSSPEAIAAVTFLGLQWQDDIREKGLTKLAFEALVRASLENTDSEHRLSRSDVHSRISQLLPDHPKLQLQHLADIALTHLVKKAVRHWQKQDEFCLTHEEKQRVSEFKTAAALSDAALVVAIDSIIATTLSGNKIPDDCIPKFTKCLRSATDAVLFGRSQAFAMAVQTGSLSALADSDFSSVLPVELAKSDLPKLPRIDWIALLRLGVREILVSNNTAIQGYMRSLADAYTLMAFLRQTPDVQGAVEKMFSHGRLWLDATVILPLIAETLAASEDEAGRFTRMIDAAVDAGLELFVTPGVLEEVERHMNRSLTCARMSYQRWEGNVPYLLGRYIQSGRSIFSFENWLENFRGGVRPIEDLAEYLKDFSISERSLESERDASSPELRAALEQIWDEKHRKRRERFGDQSGQRLDDATILKLVKHDVECYTGVVHLRTQEHASPFGYSAWWLTTDRQAFDLKDVLRQRMHSEPPDSPVMSADFMVNYLAFGPVRRKVGKSKEAHMPLLMIFGATKHLTPEILAQAEKLRVELKDLPERLIRRRIRDYLDRARQNIGPIATAGLAPLDDEIDFRRD